MNHIPKNYVSVSTRIEQFHTKYENGSIKTNFTFHEDIVSFTATVTPDIANPERVFTGSSFGEPKKEKAFEKLETVAVGRALAFAGFEVEDGIASKEEMSGVNPESTDSRPNTTSTGKVSPKQLGFISGLVKENGVSEETFKKYLSEQFDTEDKTQLSSQQASQLITELQNLNGALYKTESEYNDNDDLPF